MPRDGEYRSCGEELLGRAELSTSYPQHVIFPRKQCNVRLLKCQEKNLENKIFFLMNENLISKKGTSRKKT